jgi:hypothetical protein
VTSAIVDKLERIGHLVYQALLKTRELNSYPLDASSKQRLAELVKKTRENQRKLQTFVNVHGSNGKLDQETLDHSLDLMLKAADEISRELDKLLAKARGK